MNHISNESSGYIFSSITYLTSIVFVIIGLILFLFPPKKINSIYGYRTLRSKKNQEIWVFAQQYSSILMLKLGVISGMVYGLSLTDFFEKNMSQTFGPVFGVGFSVIIIAILLVRTEIVLKRKLSE